MSYLHPTHHSGVLITSSAIVSVLLQYNALHTIFVSPNVHSRGIGQDAWRLVEKMHPEVGLWVTHTPYFEKRNIHFYVNRLGFHIVEFFHKGHPDTAHPSDVEGDDMEMFRFEKRMW